MEDASSIMNMAARACPATLRQSLGFEDGHIVARPTDELLSVYYFGISSRTLRARIYQGMGMGGSQPLDPGLLGELSDTVESVRAKIEERIPEAREHAWQVMEKALAPFGFVMEEHGEEVRKLTAARPARTGPGQETD